MKDISFFDQHKLAVIPLWPKSKKPKLDQWQKRTFDENNESEFQPESNRGVVLGKNSNGIVDVDLDTDAAIRLAPFFLPDTGWKFGRETAPNSHWLYRIKGEVGRREAIMLDGKTFAEYRADGKQCQSAAACTFHHVSADVDQLRGFHRLSRRMLAKDPLWIQL